MLNDVPGPKGSAWERVRLPRRCLQEERSPDSSELSAGAGTMGSSAQEPGPTE